MLLHFTLLLYFRASYELEIVAIVLTVACAVIYVNWKPVLSPCLIYLSSNRSVAITCRYNQDNALMAPFISRNYENMTNLYLFCLLIWTEYYEGYLVIIKIKLLLRILLKMWSSSVVPNILQYNSSVHLVNVM